MQPKKVPVDGQPRTCPQCGLATARLVRLDNYLSLFFIPLFPIKKGRIVLACKQCGGVWDQTTPAAPPEPRPIGPRCPNCDQIVEPSHRFCPHCGQRL
ncbi:MAG: zinc ribbon domain-containing protein [Proteobacteria bacterium]|nr:zinc ribbon domain-containing protein [Pseudomonadota bacterium]